MVVRSVVVSVVCLWYSVRGSFDCVCVDDEIAKPVLQIVLLLYAINAYGKWQGVPRTGG